MATDQKREEHEMWIDKLARDLQKGDQLLQAEATVEVVQPSHHGTRTYVEWVFEDGVRRNETVESDRVIPIWVDDSRQQGGSTMQLKPGARLDNGAVILHVEASNRDGRVWVLAIRTDLAEQISLASEPVFLTTGFTDDGSRMIDGQSFTSLDAARADLRKRAA